MPKSKENTVNIIDMMKSETLLSYDLNLIPDINIILNDNVNNVLKNIENLEDNGDLQKVEILNLYSMISDSNVPTDEQDLEDIIEGTKERMDDINEITGLCSKVYDEHLADYIEGILNELDLSLIDLDITHDDIAIWALNKLCVTVTANEFLKVPNETNLLILIKIYRREAYTIIGNALMNSVSKKASDPDAVFDKGRKVDIPFDNDNPTSSLNKALRNIIDDYK